jgi:hypothetical protein
VEVGHGGGVLDEGFVEDIREGLAGEVVERRAESAGDDQDRGEAGEVSDRAGDLGLVVRGGAVLNGADAEGGGLGADPGGVGVDALAGGEFVADSQDGEGGGHGGMIRGLVPLDSGPHQYKYQEKQDHASESDATHNNGELSLGTVRPRGWKRDRAAEGS